MFKSENDDDCDVMDSEPWLASLTQLELARWNAMPQPDKDWWYANTKPDERGAILRAEILAVARHNEFLHLPEGTRKAITAQLDEQADAACIRIKQRLGQESGGGE